MVRIVKSKDSYYRIYVEDDDTNYLLQGTVILTMEKAWEVITKSMYQFNSNACLVVDETKKRHVIYRLYENGKKQKLPITIRNPKSVTVSRSDKE